LSSLWNPRTCTHFFRFRNQSSGSNHSATIPLRHLIYYYGLVFANTSESETVSVVMQGLTCDQKKIWNSTSVSCEDVPTVNSSYSPIFTITGNSKVFFNVEVRANTSAYSLQAAEVQPSNCTVILTGRFAGNPTNYSDFKSIYPNISLPRIGFWTVVAQQDSNCSSVQFKINFQEKQCPVNFGGPDCKIAINSSDTAGIDPVPLAPNQTAYYVSRSSDVSPQSLLVVARSFSGEYLPLIVASYAQLPNLADTYSDIAFDIYGCNQPDCHLTSRILQPAVTSNVVNETLWYLAIQNTGNESALYIWFNGICPPRCEIRGTCIDSGPTTGKCDCLTEDFSGLNCYTVTVDLQKLVWLAILAGVLVLTGIVGGSSVVCLRNTKPVFDVEGYTPIQ